VVEFEAAIRANKEVTKINNDRISLILTGPKAAIRVRISAFSCGFKGLR
jgi:hypothetical protein